MEKITINFTEFEFSQITYVSPKGNDSKGDGTESNPYKSWIKARNETQSGGAVYFLEGVYTFNAPDPATANRYYYNHYMTNLEKPLSIFGANGKSKLIFNFAGMGAVADRNRHTAMHLPDCNIYQLVLEVRNATPGESTPFSRNFLGGHILNTWDMVNNMNLYNCALIGREVMTYDYAFVTGLYGGITYSNSLNNCSLFTINFPSVSYQEATYINCEAMNMVFKVDTSNIARVGETIDYADIDTYLQEIPADCLNQGTGLNPDATKAHIGIYGGAFGWGEWDEPPKTKYYFIKSNGSYYTYNGSAWVDTGVEEPFSKEDFEQHGMETLHNIPYLNHLVTAPNYPNIELIEFVSVAIDVTERSLTKTLIPHNQIIKANGDITLENVQNIDSFTLTAEQSGNSIVRIATSFDAGTTWLGQGDVEIDINDTEDFLTKGRTIEQFNNYDFNTLNNGTIRNAYLIGIEDINDKAELNKLESQIDYMGVLYKQLNDNNIEVGLLNNIIKVKYKTAGDYVFNIIT